MNLRTISRKIAALAERVPVPRRVPRLCIVTNNDPECDRVARMADAERLGDPILDVTLFEPTDTDESTALNPRERTTT
jgi:hypothetical protein